MASITRKAWVLPQNVSNPRHIDRILRWVGHQAWIPRRHLLVRRLWRRAYSAVEVETEFYGFRYRAQLRDWIDWNVYFFGAYAPFELAFVWRASKALRQSGRTRIVAADVGANLGHHSVFMSKHFDEVWAFEPYEIVRERLENVIRRNRIDNVRILPTALGETNALLTVHPPP